MIPKVFRRLTANFVFFTGLLFMIMGISFLLGFMEGISRVSIFLSFLFVVIGAFFAMLAVKLNKSAVYLFFATLFMMVGIFLLLSAMKIIDLPLSRAWPLLSVFSGLALLPMCWRRHGLLRKRYVVSSCTFVILGCTLLIFSLKMAPFSFRYFIYNWWPIPLVLGGLTLVLSALGSNKGDR